jgi:long-chain acyl-CoA synthetase
MAHDLHQRAADGGQGEREVDPGRHATSWLWERATSDDDRHVLRYPLDEDGQRWDGMPVSALAQRVRSIAAGLVAAGVEPGDPVALMSATRVEWTIADLAVLAAGGVAVPIYDTSSVDQCQWILSDSGAVLALGGTSELAGRLTEAGVDSVREVLCLDDGALDDLAERGAGREAEVDRRLDELDGSKLATLVYTSGTTGRPKGCRITHGNLAWTSAQTEGVLGEMLGDDDSTLLFLPLAHVFARVVQFVCLEAGVQLGYARSIEAMRDDLQTFRPTFLLAVPRVFQKVHDSGQRQATGLKAPIFRFAEKVATEWCDADDPGAWLRFRHGLADKLVYGKLRDGVGGRVRWCVSGGAALAPHLATFFHAAGITILEGYGLTETTAPATVNRPDAYRFGTVGKVLPGVEVRIADDGEILVRGGNVFEGYHNNEEATSEVLDADGWFHTGDIGEVDDDGFLKITDRKKELIVTASGKNVAPTVLEERLKASPLVSQAMVVGDDRPFIGALITLDPEGEAAEQAKGRDPNQDQSLRDQIAKVVEEANQAVSRAESIREFVILPEDFTEDRGEMTPTMKLKRRAIAEHHHDAIESIYA